MSFAQGSRLEWSVVGEAFASDGALRDVYVHDATLADWAIAYDYVRTTYPKLEFTINGKPKVLPATAAEIFPIWKQAAPLLNFDVGGIDFACHFFTEDEIEFDLRPEEVTGPERLASLVAFLGRLAAVLRKPALLTMENMREVVFLQADPVSGTVAWIPPSDAPAG